MPEPTTTFPLFYIGSLLNTMGWPHKKGFLFKSEVVDLFVFRCAVESLVRVGTVLGIGRPETALRLLADLYAGRAWTNEEAAEIFDVFDPRPLLLPPADASYDVAIADLRLVDAPGGEPLPWAGILAPEFQTIFMTAFSKGIVWGVAHPEKARARYDEDRARAIDTAAKIGKDLGHVGMAAPFEDRLVEHEGIVSTFETTQRPIAKVPEEFRTVPAVRRRHDGAEMPRKPAESPAAWWVYDTAARQNRLAPEIPCISLVVAGYIQENTPVRRSGDEEWGPAGADPRLADAIRKAKA